MIPWIIIKKLGEIRSLIDLNYNKILQNRREILENMATKESIKELKNLIIKLSKLDHNQG